MMIRKFNYTGACVPEKHYMVNIDDSKLCRIIDDKLSWEEGNLEIALNILLKEKNTNFDSVIKNLENNPKLYDLALKIIMNEMVRF